MSFVLDCAVFVGHVREYEYFITFRVLCCVSLGAGEYECSQEALTVAALTQIQNIFITPSGKRKAAVSSHFCHCNTPPSDDL